MFEETTAGALLVPVAMGEVKLARRGETLSALLGSCVAIGLLWPASRRCALAHCLLPEAPAGSGALLRVGARYVDQAVPSLLALLGAQDADRAGISVVVAGGASMLGSAGVSGAVGRLNIAAARAALARHGLTLTHEDVGGRQGRRIAVDSAAHAFEIRKVERHVQEPDHAHN